jgi:diketogulonate reductase-like aldo/keto reductase
MHEHARSEDEWGEFLALLHRSGVTAAHSSSEYESFELFCRAVRRARRTYGVELLHVVKLANPHFGEDGFDPQRLESQVDSYRERLEVERIDCIQWMWRVEQGQEVARLERFPRAKSEIAGAMRSLQRAGKIRAVGCFPYTPDFADLVLQEAWMDYLVVYRSPWDREYDRQLDAAHALRKQVIALRPFAAGKVFSEHRTAREALDYCFSHPAVRSAVATFSTPAHLADVAIPSTVSTPAYLADVATTSTS